MSQLDVKTALRYGTIEEEIYIKQSDDYEDGSDRVCRLERNLYGLEQFSRCWNECFLKVLIDRLDDGSIVISQWKILPIFNTEAPNFVLTPIRGMPFDSKNN